MSVGKFIATVLLVACVVSTISSLKTPEGIKEADAPVSNLTVLFCTLMVVIAMPERSKK